MVFERTASANRVDEASRFKSRQTSSLPRGWEHNIFLSTHDCYSLNLARTNKSYMLFISLIAPKEKPASIWLLGRIHCHLRKKTQRRLWHVWKRRRLWLHRDQFARILRPMVGIRMKPQGTALLVSLQREQQRLLCHCIIPAMPWRGRPGEKWCQAECRIKQLRTVV